MMWSNFSFGNFFNWFETEVEVLDSPSMFHQFPSSFPPSFNSCDSLNSTVPPYVDSSVGSVLWEEDWHCCHHTHFGSEMDFHHSTMSNWDEHDISFGTEDWASSCGISGFGFDD